MNDKTYIDMIQDTGISSDIIKAVLNDRAERKSVQYDLYERYKTTDIGVPIKSREYVVAGKIQTDKINNRLNNDFFGDIIDVKAGFFVGYPIGYNLNVDVSEKDKKVLKNFIKSEHLEDIDAEMVKTTSICGESTRMLYIGKDGGIHILNLYPWETTVLYSGTEPICGFYSYEIESAATVRPTKVVEYYNDRERIVFVENKEFQYEQTSAELHGFAGCPLYTVKNNKETIGDGEKVLELIDAYDRLLSDWDNEIEQFRLAYLKATGADLTKQTIEKAKQTGVFNLPSKDADIGYIVKQLSVEAIEKLLDRIEENIYQFAQTINSRDKNFAGTITGVALSHKMTPLEQKCLIMERKITTTFRHQFKLICDVWSVSRKADIDYLDISFTFQRKYPQNLQAEAEIAQKLMGIVSRQTVLENLSIVKDVDEEQKRIEEESGVSLGEEPVIVDTVIEKEEEKNESS